MYASNIPDCESDRAAWVQLDVRRITLHALLLGFLLSPFETDIEAEFCRMIFDKEFYMVDHSNIWVHAFGY